MNSLVIDNYRSLWPGSAGAPEGDVATALRGTRIQFEEKAGKTPSKYIENNIYYKIIYY